MLLPPSAQLLSFTPTNSPGIFERPHRVFGSAVRFRSSSLRGPQFWRASSRKSPIASICLFEGRDISDHVDGADGEVRLALHHGFTIVQRFPFFLRMKEVNGLGEADDQVFISCDPQTVDVLHVRQPPHEILNVDDLAHFVSSLLDSSAAFPVGSAAAEQPDPVIDRVFDVGQKVELLFRIADPVGEAEGALPGNQLVPVLIVLHEEKHEKSEDHREKSPDITERFVELSVLPLQLLAFPAHPDFHDHVARLCQRLRVVSGSLRFLHVVPRFGCLPFPGEKAFVGLHFVRLQQNRNFPPYLVAEGYPGARIQKLEGRVFVPWVEARVEDQEVDSEKSVSAIYRLKSSLLAEKLAQSARAHWYISSSMVKYFGSVISPDSKVVEPGDKHLFSSSS